MPAINNDIHITIRMPDVGFYALREDFFRACEDMRVRPINVINYASPTESYRELLTFKNVRCSVASALDIMEQHAITLQAKGFDVTRKKVETVTWEESVKQFHGWTPRYFETHIKVMGMSEEDAFALKQTLPISGISRTKPDKLTLTLRDHISSLSEFSKKVEKVCNRTHSTFPELEWAAFDSNEALDNSWINPTESNTEQQ